MLSGGGQHAILVQVRYFPLGGASVLALDLVHFDLVPAPEGEFRAQADLANVLNGHRIDLTEQNVQELASGPPTFIALTELGSLAA
jgi:hypothetical protein